MIFVLFLFPLKFLWGLKGGGRQHTSSWHPNPWRKLERGTNRCRVSLSILFFSLTPGYGQFRDKDLLWGMQVIWSFGVGLGWGRIMQGPKEDLRKERKIRKMYKNETQRENVRSRFCSVPKKLPSDTPLCVYLSVMPLRMGQSFIRLFL